MTREAGCWSSLSDLKEIRCKSGWPVHFSLRFSKLGRLLRGHRRERLYPWFIGFTGA
jgi:hypothetical protein